MMEELRSLIGPELELIQSRIAGPAKELQSIVKMIRKSITKREHKVIFVHESQRRSTDLLSSSPISIGITNLLQNFETRRKSRWATRRICSRCAINEYIFCFDVCQVRFISSSKTLRSQRMSTTTSTMLSNRTFLVSCNLGRISLTHYSIPSIICSQFGLVRSIYGKNDIALQAEYLLSHLGKNERLCRRK